MSRHGQRSRALCKETGKARGVDVYTAARTELTCAAPAGVGGDNAGTRHADAGAIGGGRRPWHDQD